MEPETTIGAGLTIFALRDLIVKILGPTADYLGAEIKTWTEIAIKNVERIFQNAGKKLGDEIEKPGQVPPKILRAILQEGQFCDDELSAEYFGGVLASSRTSVSRDDRGVSFLSLIGRLSTYQIRSHYIFYSILKRLYDGVDVEVGKALGRLSCFIPDGVYLEAMDFGNEEDDEILVPHIMNGLTRENLVRGWAAGGAAHISQSLDKEVRDAGIMFRPSFLGMELFLWAHGLGNRSIAQFFAVGTIFEELSGITIPDGAEKGGYAP